MAGLGVHLPRGEQIAQVVVGLRQIRLMPDRLTESALRGIRVAGIQQRQPHGVVRTRQIGIEGKCLLQRALCVAHPPQLQIHVAQVGERVGVTRLESGRPFQRVRRLREPA